MDMPQPSFKMQHNLLTHIGHGSEMCITLSLFLFLFLQLSDWDFSRGKFGLLSPRKANCKRVMCYPTYGACWMFLRLRNPPNSDMDSRIFNVCTDVNARGCMGTIRVGTESWLWEKNPLPHWGIEPVSVACRYSTVPAELHPHLMRIHLKEVLLLPGFHHIQVSLSFHQMQGEATWLNDEDIGWVLGLRHIGFQSSFRQKSLNSPKKP